MGTFGRFGMLATAFENIPGVIGEGENKSSIPNGGSLYLGELTGKR